MRYIIVFLLEALAVGALGFAVGAIYLRHRQRTRGQTVGEEVDRKLAEAEAQAREMVLEAKDEALNLRRQIEAETKQQRASLQRQEKRLRRQRESLDHRLDALEAKMRTLEEREQGLEGAKGELEALRTQELAELERVAALSQEEARELFLKRVAEGARQDAARAIREIETELKEKADRLAREIISGAIQRCASDQVVETTVSTVYLPSDEMKGRIIGRGGRNIRAIENATGVDLVVDDTPEAVIVSSFDPVRREVARVALAKLISDGRIHPTRIEKSVADAKAEVEAIIKEEGERVTFEMGLLGLHRELVELLGQLKFRTSLGQNVLQHSVETARLAAMMAGELQADVELAKLGGLLHDIGKAVDHKMEGTHAGIGAEIARRLSLPEPVINAIAAHHGEAEPLTVEAVLVAAADAISGARPGARRESLESYIQRIEALEEVANSFPGVNQAYAIQAGREIRIIVKPEEIDDLGAIQLSKGIAKKVEESLNYPGQIKVTVIREIRAVDYAR